MIVIDASVVAAIVLDDAKAGEVARHRVAGQRLSAPGIVDLEVLSVLRRQRRAGLVNETRCCQAVDLLTTLPIRRVPIRELIPRIWALRDSVSAYDAAYVALAEALGATLVTADSRLLAAQGPRCAVEVLQA